MNNNQNAHRAVPKIKSSHDAIVMGLVPLLVIRKDEFRRMQVLQNNEVAAKLFIRYGGDGTPRSYITLYPGGGTDLQDQWCTPDELWAYSDTAGAILTVQTNTEVM